MKFKSILPLFFILAAFVTACDDKVNDWKVEQGEGRLYKPLIFETSSLRPTSVQIKHTQVVNAATYIFEFSKDERFENIEQQVTILADTLTVFAPSATPVRVEYRTWFEGLDGTSEYWVRMQAVNEDGTLKSNYSHYEFVTPAEQIFKGASTSVNSITMIWEPTDRITHIVLYTSEEETLENHTLTQTEKDAGRYTFHDLDMGEQFIIQIFYEDILRGTYQTKTAGLSGSSIYNVREEDTAEVLSDILTSMSASGRTDITLRFEAGKSYAMGGSILLPTGLKNITFAGEEDLAGNLSLLETVVFEIQTEVENVTFENLSLTAGGNMMFNIDRGGKFNDVVFEGCRISQVNSVVRLADGAEANSIQLNNSFVSHTGGWGMLNVGAGNTINRISVTNCTLTEINTRLADVRVKTDILFRNVTVCNIEEKMGHLWLLDNASAPTVTMEDCILSGPNGSQPVHSTNGNYSNIPISYGGNYKTNDLIEDERPLVDITEVDLTIYQLFVDPENGDFHIKPGVGFAGTGVAGDKRWF